MCDSHRLVNPLDWLLHANFDPYPSHTHFKRMWVDPNLFMSTCLFCQCAQDASKKRGKRCQTPTIRENLTIILH